MSPDLMSFIPFAALVAMAMAFRFYRERSRHQRPAFALVRPDTQSSGQLPPSPERRQSGSARADTHEGPAEETPGTDRWRRAITRWLAWFAGQPGK
jgi:hypothetical protein